MSRSLPFTALLFVCSVAFAQTTDAPATTRALDRHDTSTDHSFDSVERHIDDALWYFKLGDIAEIQMYRIASSKPRREASTTSANAGNLLVLPVYVFSPKNIKGKAPLLI